MNSNYSFPIYTKNDLLNELNISEMLKKKSEPRVIYIGKIQNKLFKIINQFIYHRIPYIHLI